MENNKNGVVKKNASEHLAPGGRGWHAVPGEGVLNKEHFMGTPSSPLWGTSPARGEVNGGFTLIELLVVVLIIGILAAVAVPQYQVAVKKAKLMKYVPIVRALNQAEQAYYLANGEYTAVLANLDVDIPSEGCTHYQTANAGYYVCGPDNKERYGIWGGVSNAQAGDDTIRYLQYFAAYSVYDIQAGDTACYSRGNIARRACRSLGNGAEKEASATGWDYIYVIPS